MRTGQTNSPALRYLRNLIESERTADLPDRELLQAFLKKHDEVAFAALIRRHGPMVLGLCRRVLQNDSDAEDAFQATFLVLTRKAAVLRPEKSLAGWLYAVAGRIAQKARMAAARRRTHEQRAARTVAEHPLDEISVREARAVLDQEMARLPDKLRLPLVLCYLEGRTRDEAAQHLGWPTGTLKSRLEQARERLRARLAARGLALSGALVALLACEHSALGAVPMELLNSTVKAASLLAAGRAATTGVVSTTAAALTEGMVQTMLFQRVITIAACVVIVSLLTVTGALALHLHSGAEAAIQAGNQPQGNGDKKEPSRPASGKRLSLPKKPAPGQAIASLDQDGNVVLRQAMIFHEGQVQGGELLPIATREVNVSLFDTKKIVATDTKGKRIGEDAIRKRLGQETAVLVTYGDGSEQMDPFHLLLIKDGTMILNVGSAYLKTLEGRQVAPNQQKK